VQVEERSPRKTVGAGIARVLQNLTGGQEQQQRNGTPLHEEISGNNQKFAGLTINERVDLLKSGQVAPHWTLPNRMGDNPLAWLIQANGLLVDARQVPREIQEAAFRRGLIPYLPRAMRSQGEGWGVRLKLSEL
jgi:hypothetical protein